MHLIQGVIQAMPFTGVCLLIGMFAIVGMPPFAIFMSKLTIISAVFAEKLFTFAALLLLFLAIVFAALLLHINKVVFGNKPKNIPKEKESLTVGDCAANAGIFKQSYYTVGDIQSITGRVALHIPGCPPEPLIIIQQLLLFLKKV